ncbi:MAG: sigma-54 dependent transcriptional regulator [candidate division KSB1 bacterium]|nr:sigma-54 dependent transcriptional regulator [candidate division KSB1 bacterium]MDZ7275747.1 sigma-54 dependent transcriptional regulator [candidate division KSB1 bacterium]MDZ7284562.1 sigma-54 dependent transcriptional regulator [candidate division KSB1 bacterium]MDZ7298019.1 sigma-54 dependent transcriptional regulator [candidate division KSB1 bacterium]MDZ7307734.1 sigma-54 dependent transcriptional regulator [candidate division KSB1 bacterium]
MPLHILIVDDEPNIRHTLSGLLTDLGHVVLACASGEEALAVLLQQPVDLILLDLRLPGLNGLEVLQRMREQNLAVPVIMMSAYADINLAVQATRLGAYNLLEKPLQPERVVLEVRHFAERLQLEAERDTLRQRAGISDEMIGQSPAMLALRQAIRKAAPSEARVLITGENGTGKELVAEALHRQSRRRDKPFVRVNCAAIPRELIESELFGHEKGAFTGATRRKIGLIEQAHGGTLFLDEIGDMSLDTQAKLLRVLQQNELMRVGGTQTLRFDVRVISATNKNLDAEISAGRFREDLYFRISVIPIAVPPLRERLEDLPLLAAHFLNQLAAAYGRRAKTLTPEAAALLMRHHWPGNVRELRNIIERLMIMNDEPAITAGHVMQALPTFTAAASPNMPVTTAGDHGSVLLDTAADIPLRDRLEKFEYELLTRFFTLTNGNVSEMARRLRTDRANLHRKLLRYNIKA